MNIPSENDLTTAETGILINLRRKIDDVLAARIGPARAALAALEAACPTEALPKSTPRRTRSDKGSKRGAELSASLMHAARTAAEVAAKP